MLKKTVTDSPGNPPRQLRQLYLDFLDTFWSIYPRCFSQYLFDSMLRFLIKTVGQWTVQDLHSDHNT